MIQIEEIFMKWIPQIGFPMAVAVYLLVRIEPRITALTNVVKDLTVIVGADSANTKGVKEAIEKLTIEIARMDSK